jgi:glutamine amidotransferase
MIGILDYGGGNVRSVQNALERIGYTSGADFFVSHSQKRLEEATKIIFPGQGRAGDVMAFLEKYSLDIFLQQTKKKVLGICVGMQVLFDFLEEDSVSGLGIVSGKVVHFNSEHIKTIPHMGWNFADFFSGTGEYSSFSSDFYFVHSYYCEPEQPEDVLSTTTYFHQQFCSSVQKENFTGVQFHPEKSGKAGEQLLRHFCTS